MNSTKNLWHRNYFKGELSLLLLGESYSNSFTARLGDGLCSPKILIEMHCSNY